MLLAVKQERHPPCFSNFQKFIFGDLAKPAVDQENWQVKTSKAVIIYTLLVHVQSTGIV